MATAAGCAMATAIVCPMATAAGGCHNEGSEGQLSSLHPGSQTVEVSSRQQIHCGSSGQSQAADCTHHAGKEGEAQQTCSAAAC